MSVARRRLVFEGRRLVAGVLLPDTAAGRAAALNDWRPGTTVRACGLGLLVRYEAPREVDCELMHGEALLEWQGSLVAAPATPKELEALGAPRGSLIVARGGALVAIAPSEELDPAAWLTPPAATVVEVPRPVLAAGPMPVALAPPPLVLRPDPGALPAEAARALTEALGGPGSPRGQALWRRVATSLLRWWRERRRPAAPGPAGSTAAPSAPLARLEAWVNRQLDATPVGRWLDDFNRGYVDRLLRLFEREALDEALKHAVPLSRKQAEPGAPAAHLPLAPRAAVAVNFGARGGDGAPSTIMRGDVYEALKQRYRAAAAKLEAAGRIDEAAFVLADLLDAPQEAVELFERHRQFDKAARLAEGRRLSPELVVRLWVLAKNLERATLVARRHRVFAAAVAKLEQGHLAEARLLRVQWGEWLASSGDFAGAVQAIGPLKEARALMLKWVDLGIEAGGPQRPVLLVRRLELEPAAAAPYVDAALALLSQTAEATAAERAALGEALVSSTDVASLELRRPLARAAIRAIVRDEAASGVTRPGVVGRLLAFDEGPLRADVPSYAPGVRRLEPAALRFEREGGAQTPHDAVVMPSGAVLVALGESGVALVNPDGRVTWRAEVPAFSLVASDEGVTVLALAKREDVTTVSRLSLAPRTAARWADVQLSCWSDTFRDGVWFIAAGPRVLGLDVLGERPVTLWDLPPRAGFVDVAALASSPTRVSALNSHLVVARRAWRLPAFDEELLAELHQAEGVEALAVDAEGGFVLVSGVGRELRAWTPGPHPNQPVVSQALPGALAGTVACRAGVFAAPVQWRREAPHQVDVLLRPGERSFGFAHATRVHTRFQGAHLVMCCDNGHVVVFDTASRSLWRDVVVKP